MKSIHAIYENGVFRPLDHVDLPECTKVEFIPRLIACQSSEDRLDETYAILSKSFDTDNTELAERHDEHQP